MRKTIRPFVVERRARLHSPLFPADVLEHAKPRENAPPTTAREVFGHPSADAAILDRPAPKRVLPALDQEQQHRPSRAADAVEGACSDARGGANGLFHDLLNASSASDGADQAKDRSDQRPASRKPATPSTRVRREKTVIERETPDIQRGGLGRAASWAVDQEPASTDVPSQEALTSSSGRKVTKPVSELPPGFGWAARLPQAAQRRILERSRRR